ncbi:MAG: Uma2 family endonuclease, partial [Arthrospira sp. PLM2.Bin9]
MIATPNFVNLSPDDYLELEDQSS